MGRKIRMGGTRCAPLPLRGAVGVTTLRALRVPRFFVLLREYRRFCVLTCSVTFAAVRFSCI